MFAKWKVAALFAATFAAADVSAICTSTLVNGQCVGCPIDHWALAASYNSAGGCLSRSVACRSFAPAKSESVATESERLAGALNRSVNLTNAQLSDVADRNPWAAATLLAIETTGSLAALEAGNMAFDKLPTKENFSTLLAGMPNTTPLPNGVRARVSYHLVRGPGEMATMTLSAFTVDEDDRMLYKVYPDVMVEFAETPATPSRGSSEALVSRQDDGVGLSRALVATRWQVVQ